MPEWKSEVGRQVDAIVNATLPEVRKAVKCQAARLPGIKM
jgi:hypothetical protein